MIGRRELHQIRDLRFGTYLAAVGVSTPSILRREVLGFVLRFPRWYERCLPLQLNFQVSPIIQVYCVCVQELHPDLEGWVGVLTLHKLYRAKSDQFLNWWMNLRLGQLPATIGIELTSVTAS